MLLSARAPPTPLPAPARLPPYAVNPVRKEVLVFTCTGLVLTMISDGPGFWVGWAPPHCWLVLDAPLTHGLLAAGCRSTPALHWSALQGSS